MLPAIFFWRLRLHDLSDREWDLQYVPHDGMIFVLGNSPHVIQMHDASDHELAFTSCSKSACLHGRIVRHAVASATWLSPALHDLHMPIVDIGILSRNLSLRRCYVVGGCLVSSACVLMAFVMHDNLAGNAWCSNSMKRWGRRDRDSLHQDLKSQLGNQAVWVRGCCLWVKLLSMGHLCIA